MEKFISSLMNSTKMERNCKMSDEDRFKILDVRMPKEEQEKSEPLLDVIRKKKWQVDFKKPDGKVRFAYTDNPEPVEVYLKAQGFKILKVHRL